MALSELANLLDEAEVMTQANQRYTDTESYQARLISLYRKMSFWYAPPGFDQWPEDAMRRPGKLHITENIVKPAVDVEARLQAKLPRLSLVPTDLSQPERARAEVTEKMMLAYLEATGWETWMQTLCRTKAIFGKGVLKVMWNSDDKRPDVRVVENPANLRIGWGSSDFSDMDWALYEYKLSPTQVMRRWPDLKVMPAPGNQPLVVLPKRSGTHDDPLGQKLATDPATNYTPSDYENKQVLIWDYWYLKEKQVCNAIIVQRRQYAKEPTVHRELLDIPYVVIENDHEPGSPEGISSILPLLDIQIEKNRVMSNWAQVIYDETARAYQINADSVPGGLIPKPGELLPVGEEHEVKPIGGGPQTFPAAALNDAFWFDFHRISGLPEVAFGNPGGADVSGRALAVQIEGAANRIDPRRTLLYGGLRELLIFWTVMLERLNPKIEVGEGQKVGIGPFVKGFRRWRIIAPEITPRDVIEHTQNTINKINAGIMSSRTGMDETGIDSPEDELHLIAEERSNIDLNPGFVQQKAAVLATIQQLQLTQLQADQQQQLQGATPGAALATAQDQTGANNVMAQQQQAQPALLEDQNGISTGPGGVPPGAPTGGTQTTLVRANPAGEATTLNQIAFNRPL
jgi:hypothetical protein